MKTVNHTFDELLEMANQVGKAQLKKTKSHAFGKDVYLLGADKDGIKYWLEAPKWDCGWYWGFGYVETYTNNDSPARSRDINSHQHIDGSFLGAQEVYDHKKGCFVKGEYIHNLYDSPAFALTTFTESEGWILSELFNTFYQLKEQAELYGRGGMHTTTNPLKDLLTNEAECKRINEVLIPAVTAKIIEILS